MINVQSEYMEDQPSPYDEEDDQDPNDPPLEPKKHIKSDFLELDNEAEFPGPTVNMLSGRKGKSVGNSGIPQSGLPGSFVPKLPAGLQKIKDIYDFFETQKAMETVRKEKKKVKRDAKELERLVSNQERIIDKVKNLKDKNERLEDYFSQGLSVKKLKKGEQITGKNGYNPLDDISFEDVDDILEDVQEPAEAEQNEKPKKKSKKGQE